METKDECVLKIAARDLSFSYPNGKQVFERLTFDIPEGRVLSVLGPNGSGKSTLLSCLARLLVPKSGDVLFDGKSYRRMSPREIARSIGFVPQDIIPSFDYTVIDYVVTGCAPRMGVFQKPKADEYEAAWDAIETMKLEHLAEKSFMRISSGERQQVAIARVIAQDPSVILLDEPTAHLDLGNQMKVLEMLSQLASRGYGIVMSTHNPDHVLLLDDLVAVIDGRGDFTLGTAREVLDEEFLHNLYGTRLRLFDIDSLGRRICVAQGLVE